MIFGTNALTIHSINEDKYFEGMQSRLQVKFSHFYPLVVILYIKVIYKLLYKYQ